MKMIGKPYSGKLNVRFDEGVLEIGYGWASEALLTERDRNR
jgi:predicted HicB family RNase H-like nuclease